MPSTTTGPRYQVRTILRGKPTQRTKTFATMTEVQDYMNTNRFSSEYTFEVYEVVTTKTSLGIF
jgi:hypothetical protein